MKTLLLSFLMVLISSGFQHAHADSCDSYTLYSEDYFACLFDSDTLSFTDNCVPREDDRFPDEEVIKLMAHDTIYNDGTTTKFVGLVKDGASLVCPTNQAYWQVGTAYEGKIVVRYQPCNGKIISDNDFLDGIDCNPSGKDADAVDDLDNSSSRKNAATLDLAVGECKKAHDVTFCAELNTPYVCAYVPNGPEKIYVGCNEITPTHTSVAPPSFACFIPNLCWDKNALSNVSKNPIGLSISGAMVMCAEGAIEKVFFSGWDSSIEIKASQYGAFGLDNQDPTACPTVSMFHKVQQSLRTAAVAAITLWVILWGIRVMVSGAAPSRGEFIKNIITVSLVMYFSLGAGWTEYLPILKQLMSGLSQAMMTALSANDPGAACVHTASEYPEGFETMALWDMFDCKLITYFFSDTTYPKMLEIAILSIFTVFFYGLIILLLTLLFAFFLIALLIFSVEIYLVSLVIIALLVFLSPIFIPMVLFDATKGYFKAWLSELISVSLYPVILFGFMALMLAVFDRFYFGDCQDPGVTCTSYPFGTDIIQAEGDSLGASVNEASTDWDNLTVSGFKFDLYLLQLVKVCIFSYLFFRFMSILGPFIAELAGSAKTDLSSIGSGLGQKFASKATSVTATTGVGAGKALGGSVAKATRKARGGGGDGG